MKKIRQILAIIGIVFLLSLYLITLICAITDSSGTMQLLFASVVATAIIPVLLWTYSFIYRLLKENYGPDSRGGSADSLHEEEDSEVSQQADDHEDEEDP